MYVLCLRSAKLLVGCLDDGELVCRWDFVYWFVVGLVGWLFI